jgi:DNA-binding NtrC family response regulator
MKLAIVDDEYPTLEIMRDNLKPTGFITDIYDSPLKALDAIETEEYDVIITDFKMPEMNGIEFLKEIKKTGQNVYVIIITGYADIYNTMEAVNNGAYAFFRKPLNFPKFLQTLYNIEKQITENHEKEEYVKNLADENMLLKNVYKDLNNSTEISDSGSFNTSGDKK